VRYAITEFLGLDAIRGKRLLEIGAADGKMSTLFATLGARVTGVDVDGRKLADARDEAQRFGVEDAVDFIKYDGHLDIFASGTFDVVFTKSVLVLMSDLRSSLLQISRVLRNDGQIVFVENAYGNVLLHGLRLLWHRRWDYHGTINVFTGRELDEVASVFRIEGIKGPSIPPVYLITGHKRQG
jgi:SAM-dependent methyltransferase